MSSTVLFSMLFLSNLRSIHEAGVLHGNLSLDSLLVQNSGDITIANFSQARMDVHDDQLREEYQSMSVLLNSIP